MLPEYKEEAALRLKVAAGHLEGVRRMVDEDRYCVDLMKQLSAVQGTLQRVQRILLRNHLSSCVSTAIKDGMGEAIIDELMGALKYDTSLIDGRGATGYRSPARAREAEHRGIAWRILLRPGGRAGARAAQHHEVRP